MDTQTHSLISGRLSPKEVPGNGRGQVVQLLVDNTVGSRGSFYVVTSPFSYLLLLVLLC